MKRIFKFLSAVLVTASMFLPQQANTQSPEKMSYQAVIRNSSDQLVTNTQVGMQISILQGSASGTPVYVETQTPTTNANGLISIEIGTGTSSDDLSTINWADGPYFIKTEIDPSGGTDYSITGTSQLLSVPYALHASTAETVTGSVDETDPVYGSSVASGITESDTTNWNNKLDSYTETDPVFGAWDKSAGISITESQISDLGIYIENETDPVYGSSVASGITASDTTNWNNKLDSYTETDPVFSASEAANITANDITNLSNLSGVNTGDQDISGIVTNTQAIQDTASNLRNDLAAKNNVLTLDNTTAFAPDADYEPATKKYVDDNSGATIYSVGDFAQGGIVFWVDATGQHGLVCAKDDQSTSAGIRWYAGTYGYTQAKGDGPFAGEANTSIIIAAHVAIGDDGSTYSARICNDLQITEGGKTYGDWYLPSKMELNLMYQNREIIDSTATANGGTSFASVFYWSSTERIYYIKGEQSSDGDASNFLVWCCSFDSGSQGSDLKENPHRVRAVRAF